MTNFNIDSLKVELRRGTQIILVLSQLKSKEYGYSLLEKLENSNMSIEAGTLYPLLRRLESQGLLNSEWDTTESRPRKYYLISDFGITVLDVLIEEWKQINEELKFIWGEK